MRFVLVAGSLLLSLFFLIFRVHARAAAKARSRLENHTGSDAGGEAGAAVRVVGHAVAFVERTGYMRRLRELAEASGIHLHWRSIELAFIIAAILIPALAAALSGSLLTAPPVFLAVILVPFPVLDAARRKRFRKTADECEQMAADISVYLRCGVPAADALALCARGAGRTHEVAFDRFTAEVAVGTPADEALLTLARTLENADLELVALALGTSRQTGADVRIIMESIGEAVRERAAIRRELDSQTIQGRLSGRIVAALPFLFLLLSMAVSRGTLQTLLGSVPGIVMLVAASILDLIGFFWIRKILDIKT